MHKSDMPDTADGKRLEADALERRAAELILKASYLRNAAEEQAEREAETELAEREAR